ncbi:MAG TPA: LPS export ABC transporter periplasmic protein LptC, partial [Gemmatimonadaceae bacterium]|nr:LPS export ABC transporter periplasmic protein LptC [Gemmatimonadaceae bacterium]
MRAILLIVFASATVVACSSKKEPPVATHSPLADSADQVMFNASFMLTDKGLARAQMQGDTLYFFEDNTRIESDNPHITFFTATGAKDAVLTAKHGTSNTRTNNMIARGNVVVVSEDGRRLTTEELIYNQFKNEISSDSAFVLTEPDRHLEGVGFRSDPNMKNIRILSGVSGLARGVSTEGAAQTGQGQVFRANPGPSTPVRPSPAASSSSPASGRSSPAASSTPPPL